MEVGRADAAADDVEAGPLEELLERLEHQLVRSGEDARSPPGCVMCVALPQLNAPHRQPPGASCPETDPRRS